ncbi:MAG: hypothetical protein ACRDBH_03055 [Bosea sp. (in: a-proteobacteria)]
MEPNATIKVRKPRDWPARLNAVLFLLAALLTLGVWAGITQNAFVAWDSIHALYFRQSYAAGLLPFLVAGSLLVLGIACLWRLRVVVPLSLPVLVIAALNEYASGKIGLFSAWIHPMQGVPRAALVLMVVAMALAAFLATRRQPALA